MMITETEIASIQHDLADGCSICAASVGRILDRLADAELLLLCVRDNCAENLSLDETLRGIDSHFDRSEQRPI